VKPTRLQACAQWRSKTWPVERLTKSSSGDCRDLVGANYWTANSAGIIQWNLGNTTNHGTDVGWSGYRGGRVGEVENLGVNFMITYDYLPACTIEVMHEALFMTRTKITLSIIIELIILS
jgi:hypothetical protein